MPTPRELLERLDSRHDELIRKLDELNSQIEATLAQFAQLRGEELPSLDAMPAIAIAADQSAPRRAA